MSEIAGYNDNSVVIKLYKEIFNGNVKRAEFSQKSRRIV